MECAECGMFIRSNPPVFDQVVNKPPLLGYAGVDIGGFIDRYSRCRSLI
jgi:hypothetical protein